MTSRMRVTKGHSGNRRSHHGIDMPRLSICSNCNEYHKRHNLCKKCGFYKGSAVVTPKQKKAAVAVADSA